MKTQDQTTFGPSNGNCLPACIAIILGINVDKVPHFCRTYHYWQAAMNDWLAEVAGLSIITIAWPLAEMPTAFPRGGLVILTGKSPRFPTANHSVVGRINKSNGEAVQVFDPHPSRTGLKVIFEVDYFVKLIPDQLDESKIPNPLTWEPTEGFRVRKAVPSDDSK